MNLVSLSNKITITLHYSIILEETNTTRKGSTEFTHLNQADQWLDEHLLTDDIKHLKSFTFKVNIKLLGVFDINNNFVNNYSVFQSPIMYDIPMNEFIWKITNQNEVKYVINAKQDLTFESEVFEIYNCKWVLELCPSNSDYYCDLFLSLDVSVVCIKHELFQLETNTID